VRKSGRIQTCAALQLELLGQIQMASRTFRATKVSYHFSLSRDQLELWQILTVLNLIVRLDRRCGTLVKTSEIERAASCSDQSPRLKRANKQRIAALVRNRLGQQLTTNWTTQVSRQLFR